MARGPVDVDSCFLLTVNLQDNAHILAAIDCQASALGNSRCVGLGLQPCKPGAPRSEVTSPNISILETLVPVPSTAAMPWHSSQHKS